RMFGTALLIVTLCVVPVAPLTNCVIGEASDPEHSARREAFAPLKLGLSRLLEVHLSSLDLTDAGVSIDRHPSVRGPALDESHCDRDRAVAEESLPSAEDNGENPEAELVDQIMLEQGLEETWAAVYLNLRGACMTPSREMNDDQSSYRFLLRIDA